VVDAADAPASQAKYGEDTFVVIEKWSTMEQLKVHATAPHMVAYAASVRDILVDRRAHILQDA
jgi:quinol monooxygenase YgiN